MQIVLYIFKILNLNYQKICLFLCNYLQWSLNCLLILNILILYAKNNNRTNVLNKNNIYKIKIKIKMKIYFEILIVIIMIHLPFLCIII